MEKLVHASLRDLLQDVKNRNIEAVYVAAFMQSDVVANGIPRYTAYVVVGQILNSDLRTEWRLLIGHGRAEITERGPEVPPRIADAMAERLATVRARVSGAGLGVLPGLLASGDEGMDGVLD